MIGFFGLGFVQVKLSETERWHFYSPELPAYTEGIHNHRYEFRSTVRYGALRESRYVLRNGGEWVCEPVSCVAGVEATGDSFDCTPFSLGNSTHPTGSTYLILPHMFHTVEPVGPTITQLIRGPYVEKFARVCRPKIVPRVCPFSITVEETILRKIVSEMLTSAGLPDILSTSPNTENRNESDQTDDQSTA